jgi:cytochrome c peroxidase
MKIHQIIMVLGLGFSSILQAARLTPEQQLGGLLYKDRNLSLNRNQACATCHAMKALQIGDQIAAGFVDPNNALTGSAVSKGSQPKQFGALNAPTVGYAAFSPEFHWSAEKKGYIGGQFWNGRAKNLQEQAKGPFLNPAEMAMPNAWAVITRLQENSLYIKAFKDLYAIDLNTIPPYVNNQPEPPTIAPIYDKLAKAISEFEKSFVFNKFTAKLDYVFAKKTNLTQQEKFGMDLFRGKARCTTCHTDLFKFDAKGQPLLPPLFSDFSYHNVGSPRNVTIPNNPYPDLGLGFRDDIREIDPFRNW